MLGFDFLALSFEGLNRENDSFWFEKTEDVDSEIEIFFQEISFTKTSFFFF